MKVVCTHPDKILFPKSKITKKDLFLYYQKIAPAMIPKMKDRPVSMLRYPNGIKGEGFYQKNISDYFPKWIKSASIGRKEKKAIRMLLCNDAETLLYLANQACITPHIWLSRYDKLKLPDRMIFDLDPPSEKAFPLVMQAAKDLREILEKKWKLKTFVMTTGSKGLHVVVPIQRDTPFAAVRALAKKIAAALATQNPKEYTIESRIKERKGRIFIDYLRNAYAQTAVAPYAVRAIEGAPVATPIDWKEVKKGLHSQKFTIKNVVKRALGKDPWEGMERAARSVKNLSLV